MAVSVNGTLAGPRVAEYSNIYGALGNLGRRENKGALDIAGTDPQSRLSSYIRQLGGGDLWLPGVDNYVLSTDAAQAGIGDPVGYVGSLASYNSPENMCKNSEFVGAALPSTASTNWSIPLSTLEGITTSLEAVDAGSITIRVAGTVTDAATRFLVTPPTDQLVPCVPAELWSAQAVVEIAGTYPANRAKLTLYEYSSSLVLLATSAVIIPAGISTPTVARVINQSTVAYVRWAITVQRVIGEVLDFTIKISKPQLERGRARAYVPTPENDVVSRGIFNPAHQATTSFKPILEETNGRKNWRFDGVDDRMFIPGGITTEGYMCVVASSDVLGVTAILMGGYKATATIQAGAALGVSATSGAQLYRVASDGTTGSGITTTTVVADVPAVLDGNWTVSRAEARMNGAGEGVNTATRDSTNTGNCMYMGANNTGTNAAPVAANLALCRIYAAARLNFVPTDEQAAQLRKLMATFGSVPGVI